MHRDWLSHHLLFLVTWLFIICTEAEESSATSCEGRLSPVVGDVSNTVRRLTSSDRNKVLPLVGPACITANSTVNITYRVLGKPSNDYLIVSGNITGRGTVTIDDGTNTIKRYGTWPDHKNIVYNTLRGERYLTINYYTTSWVKGDGPYLELYYSTPNYDYCRNQGMICTINQLRQHVCLPNEWKCNQREECRGGADESDCAGCCKQESHVSSCNDTERCQCVPGTYSWMKYPQLINSCLGEHVSATLIRDPSNNRVGLPIWPQTIPYNITYTLTIPTSAVRANLTVAFSVLHKADLRDQITLYHRDVMKRVVKRILSDEQRIVSASVPGGGEAYLNLLMLSPHSRYNFTYSVRQDTAPTSTVRSVPEGARHFHGAYSRSCNYKNLYFTGDQHCNNYMDCPNGLDELGCGTMEKNGRACGKNEIMCAGDRASGDRTKPKCFTMSQRCDGNNKCTDKYDELNCDNTLCGTHNGTFLCADKMCIFETWLCDKTKDCNDGDDELNCDGTSLKVVTASVIGSLVCAIMIVIAVGCSCKLHTHRLYESLHQRSRYESPMTLITNELMSRRTPPPPYAETMQRSRPFEEARSEYLAALEQRRNEAAPDYEEETLDEERSIVSASGALEDMTDESLVNVGDSSSVTYRRNPNKPPETAQPLPEPLLPDLMSDNATGTLEPKSDEEDGGPTNDQPASESLTDDNQTNNSHSRRHVLRRSSVDSDVSLLSRDSDDVPLLH